MQAPIHSYLKQNPVLSQFPNYFIYNFFYTQEKCNQREKKDPVLLSGTLQIGPDSLCWQMFWQRQNSVCSGMRRMPMNLIKRGETKGISGGIRGIKNFVGVKPYQAYNHLPDSLNSLTKYFFLDLYLSKVIFYDCLFNQCQD